MSEIDVLLHDVNKNREDGKVLFATIDGVMSANLAEFITQPADGILYDLNRDEVTTASFGITTRTINDLAVATVIRYLRAELARRDEKLALTEDKLCNIDRSARAEIARRDEYILKLEAKIPKLNIDLAEASMHAYNGESARMKLEAELASRDEIIARLKEDGERLATRAVYWDEYGNEYECIHLECGAHSENILLEHYSSCPITLHRALMKELE